MHQYKELIVWQESRKLVSNIYQMTNTFPVNEQFGIVSQMRRCVYSIPSNIAEGAGSGSDKDFSRFLDIANGSDYELEPQLILCCDIGYISEESEKQIFEKLTEIQKMLFALKSKLSK